MFSDYVIELCDKTRLWLETAPANCGILLFFTIGFLVSIWNLLYSLCSYFENKAWRVNDLEKIIGNNLKVYDVDSNFEKMIVAECNENYSKYLFNKERRNKFFDKLKSFFKR